MSVIGNIGAGAGVLAAAGAAGTGGYVAQQLASGDRFAEQVSAERRAGRAFERGDTDDAKHILKTDRPSNRERDWDKLGVITGASTLAGVAGILPLAADMYSAEGQLSRGGKIGGVLVATAAAATIGAAVSAGTNVFGDRFE